MQIFKSEGIVFRSMKYSETSVIIDIYLREKGLRSFIISGVRSSKSKVRSSLYHPMNILSIVAYDKDNDKLARIKEACYDTIYQKISLDVKRSAIAMLMIELSRNTIKEKEANTELYNFIKSSLLNLDAAGDNLNEIGWRFMLGLTRYLGFYPANNFSERRNLFNLQEGKFVSNEIVDNTTLDKPSSIMLLNAIQLMNIENRIEPHQISPPHLVNLLLQYYSLHVDGFKRPLSIDILRDIL